jgi:hypothetical protein
MAIQLQNICNNILQKDFQEEFKEIINSRKKYMSMHSLFSVLGNISVGTTTILAFLSSSLNLPILSLTAGISGVTTSILFSYSNYCKTQYENNTKIIEDMTGKIKLEDILTDNSKYMNDKEEE